MEDPGKTNKQLIEELTKIPQQKVDFLKAETLHGKTKDALRKSDERFRLMADNIQDGLAIVENNKLVYVNKRLSEISGYSTKELLNLTIFDIIVPEQKEQIMDVYKKFKQTGKVPKGGDYDIFRKDGVRRTIHSKHSLSNIFEKEPDHYVIITDITEQKQTEEILRKQQEHLEDLIANRTAELAQINEQLRREIEERKITEQTLINKEKELQTKTMNLEEVNTALKVLLKRRDEDKDEFSERLQLNIRELVLPYIAKIMQTPLKQNQKNYLSVLDSNLDQIISPFLHTLSSRYSNLTPTEIRVANLVKAGRTTKEIAEIMTLAKRTIDFYRENIRKKLGLNNSKKNLRTYLLTLQ